MRNIVLLFTLFCSFVHNSLLDHSGCSPSSTFGISEKDQCNLCDENCKRETDSYYKGDHKEILQSDRQVYIAINRATDENNYCYICISYYNTSQHNFTFDDIIIVKYQDKTEKDLNHNRTWDIKYDGKRGGSKYTKHVYIIWSTKGS